MPRPKVDRQAVSMRLRTETVALADAGARRGGMSRTEFVERAIRHLAHGAPGPEIDPHAPPPGPRPVPAPGTHPAART